jgi:hypothetical protein
VDAPAGCAASRNRPRMCGDIWWELVDRASDDVGQIIVLVHARLPAKSMTPRKLSGLPDRTGAALAGSQEEMPVSRNEIDRPAESEGCGVVELVRSLRPWLLDENKRGSDLQT